MTKKINYLFLLCFVAFSCTKSPSVLLEYKTQNVIIIIMDGARYSETWGDPFHTYIPKMEEMSNLGIANTNFFNEGITITVPGHAAITTGIYEEINNRGLEYPQNVSLFQHWLAAKNEGTNKAWIISSKDKLEVLSDCLDPEWNKKFTPSSDCGVNGLGSGYRTDNITFNKVMEILPAHHPQLVLINFKEPDSSGHGGNWEEYLNGIMSTDNYIYEIWNYIESDPFYKEKTTLFITNDHGRHLDKIADGFKSHGDDCEGCRHINLITIGPDFKSGIEIDEARNLTDISATIAELLEFDFPSSEGVVMEELFK